MIEIERKLFEAGSTSRMENIARKQVLKEISKGLITPEELEYIDQRIKHDDGMKTKYMLRYIKDELLTIQNTIYAIEQIGLTASAHEISIMFSDIKLLLPDLITYLTRVSTDNDWIPVAKDLPQDAVIVYVTVRKMEQDPKVLEGFFEDGNWFNIDGHSLKHDGLDVVAWMPKKLPEPCIQID